MTPDDKVRKLVARLNQRLLDALGYPAYAWYFSEGLLLREMRTQTDSGIHLLSPQYRTRKLLPDLDHQWVLCREVSSEVIADLGDNHKDNQWILRNAQGSGITPCGTNGNYVATRKFHAPTVELNESVIGLIQRFRDKPSIIHMEEMFASQDKAQDQRATNKGLEAAEKLRTSGWMGSGSDHPWVSMSGKILVPDSLPSKELKEA